MSSKNALAYPGATLIGRCIAGLFHNLTPRSSNNVMNRIRIILSYVLVVAVALCAGCSREPPSRPESSIRIGAILPLTGPASWLGEQELIGLEAAAEAYSAKSGANIKIVIKAEDTASQAAKAVTAAQKLIDVDHVDAIFVTTSSAYKAVAPVADRAGMPVLVMASEPRLIQDHPTSFRIYMNFDDEAKTMAGYVRQSKAKTVAIVRMNLEAFAGSVASLRSHLGSAQSVIGVEEAYEVTTRDFRSIVEKLGAARPDLLVILPLGGEFPTLIEQIRQNPGLAKIPVLAGYAVAGPPALQKGTELFEGVTFTVFPVARSAPAIHSVFAGRRTRSGLELSDFMDYAYAYDSVTFIVEAAQRRTPNQSLLEAMRDVSRFEGITGKHVLHDRQISIPLRLAHYDAGVLTLLP